MASTRENFPFDCTPQSFSEVGRSLQRIKRTLLYNNLSATTNPAATDDKADGYEVGSRWINVSADTEYVCVDATVGAAVWKLSAPSSGSSPASGSYVTMALEAGLTDERKLTTSTSVVVVDGGAGANVTLERAALTGDATASQNSNALTLATVNSNVGTFGSATQVAQVTVNGKGLVTAASNTAISLSASAVSAAGSNTQLQYNNAGAFAGTSGLTWDGTNLNLATTQALLFRGESIGMQSSSSGVMDLVATTGVNVYGDIINLLNASIAQIASFQTVASAVDYLVIENAATGSPATLPITATGTDTDINVNIVPKGTGHLQEAGVNVLTTATGQPLDALLTDIAALTIAQGDLLIGVGTDDLRVLNKNTSATRYLSNTGTSNDPAWAQVDLSNGVTGDLPFANLTQGSALSVLGVTGNATADNASIAAASDHQVLRRSGTAVAFGPVNLASSNAVTGLLPRANITTSGTVIARLIKVKPPATSGAVETSLAGGSSPAEDFNVWAFDQTGPEYLDFYYRLSPQYAGGGLTIKIFFSAAATTNNVRWGAAIRRFQDNTEQLSASQTYDYNDVAADVAVPGSTTIAKDATITFSSGADMDSLAAGEFFILRVRRTAATSNCAADGYLWDVEVRET